MFSKNIRRIKTPKELFTVASAHYRWLAYVDKTIYKRLMGMHVDWKESEETWAAKQVRVAVWKLIGERYIFMVDGLPYYVKQKVFLATNTEYPNLRFDDSVKEEWDVIYSYFDKARNKSYARYTKIVRDTFDAIDEWLAETPEKEMKDRHKEETFTHAGVAVRIIADEKKDAADDRQSIKKYLEFLTKSVDVLRKIKPFSELLRKVVFELVLGFSERGVFTAGEYEAGKMIIRSYLLGLSMDTIIHEFGHCFWYEHLSDAQRTAWTDFVNRNKVQFSAGDMIELRAAFEAAIKELDAAGKLDNAKFMRMGIWSNMTKHIKNPRLKSMYLEYLKAHEPTLYWDGVEKKDKTFEFFKEVAEQPFFIHAPTEYASTNEKEAFAETFLFYVVGPVGKIPGGHQTLSHLSPVAKHQFELVTGLVR